MSTEAPIAEPDADADQLFGKRLLRKLVLPGIIGVIAYAALLLYGDARGVVAGFARLPAQTLLFGIALSLGSFALRWVRWQLYLGATGIRVQLRQSVLIFVAGLGMSITPGKVGELLKSLLLKAHDDIPVARSAPIIVAERLTDLLALLVLGVLGLLGARSPLIAGALALSGTFALFLLVRWQRLAHTLIALLTKVSRLARFREKLLTAHASLYALWGASTYAGAVLLALAAWGTQAFIIVVFARAFSVEVTLPQAAVAYSAPLLAGAVALLPGGLGMTEASMAGALKALAGASATVAATLTILIRGVTFWLAILLGFAALAAVKPRQQEAVGAR